MSKSSYLMTAFLPSERLVLNDKQLPYLFRSQLVGSMRATRVSRCFINQTQQLIWETSTTVIGPIFFFYVWWVLQQAKTRKLERLYFLSRDGKIFFEIARLINEQYQLGIDCRYLYGSRQSWLVPSIKRISQDDLNWMLSDWWYELSIQSICNRIGFNPKEIIDLLTKQGFREERFSQRLSRTEIKSLKSLLLSEEFNSWYLKRFKDDANNLLGYLKQEGLMDPVLYAIVDVGWRGNQQSTLRHLLNNYFGYDKPILGFYFGLTEAQRSYPGDELCGFMFNLSRSLDNFGLRNNHLTEAFTASVELRTTRFNNKSDHYFPVQDGKADSRLINWGVDTQIEGILTFCRFYLNHVKHEDLLNAKYKKAVSRILSNFIKNPTKAQADLYGSFPLDGGLSESNLQEIAPITTKLKFLQACLNLKTFRFFWVQATLIRSNMRITFYLWKVILPILAIGFYLLNRVIKWKRF